MSTKTDVDFRISMLAPSRAGKTTLLASIYNVLRERTTESGYQVGFDKANQKLLNILKNEYEAIFATAQKKFEETGERIFSPSMGIKPSVEQTSYKIFIHTPEQRDFYDKRKSIPEMLAGILFRDYYLRVPSLSYLLVFKICSCTYEMHNFFGKFFFKNKNCFCHFCIENATSIITSA